jgi:hypothetical protein
MVHGSEYRKKRGAPACSHFDLQGVGCILIVLMSDRVKFYDCSGKNAFWGMRGLPKPAEFSIFYSRRNKNA